MSSPPVRHVQGSLAGSLVVFAHPSCCLHGSDAGSLPYSLLPGMHLCFSVSSSKVF